MYLEEETAPNELLKSLERLENCPNSSRLCSEFLGEIRGILTDRQILSDINILRANSIFLNYWKTNLVIYYKQHNLSKRESLRIFLSTHMKI